ncbi:MAG: DUF3108 domain-containing protein [Candidatus Poribacteria bacterium]|nr:DUF3108 domain-containing protein [Candidatus Poribacteria bacterium]
MHPTEIVPLKRQFFAASVLTCLALLCLRLSASTQQSLLDAPDIEPYPVRVGEILTYTVKIAGISAGKQVTEVVDRTTIDGHDVYRLTSESRTNSLFAKFYHFQDLKESYITTDQFYPIRFSKNLEDRSYRAHVRVNFFCEGGAAEYTKNEACKRIKAPVGTQDELSMVYFVRSKDFKVGQTYTFPVLIKDAVQDVVLTAYRREVMKTEALGRVETIALRTSHGYLIWLTNDEHRFPVRIEAETRRGKLVGTLKSVDFAK